MSARFPTASGVADQARLPAGFYVEAVSRPRHVRPMCLKNMGCSLLHCVRQATQVAHVVNSGSHVRAPGPWARSS
jgi:hypothetical protein